MFYSFSIIFIRYVVRLLGRNNYCAFMKREYLSTRAHSNTTSTIYSLQNWNVTNKGVVELSYTIASLPQQRGAVLKRYAKHMSTFTLYQLSGWVDEFIVVPITKIIASTQYVRRDLTTNINSAIF